MVSTNYVGCSCQMAHFDSYRPATTSIDFEVLSVVRWNFIGFV